MKAPGQQSLENFYISVQFSNPAMAQRMAADIRTVALYSLAANHEPGYAAVARLRELAFGLPPVQSLVLDNALNALGYDLDQLYDIG